MFHLTGDDFGRVTFKGPRRHAGVTAASTGSTLGACVLLVGGRLARPSQVHLAVATLVGVDSAGTALRLNDRGPDARHFRTKVDSAFTVTPTGQPRYWWLAMGSEHLQLLGGFALRSADCAVDVAGGLQRFLAFLALRGPSHRCLVAGTLWPDVPESHALASLRTAMWRLNRLVPGVVTAQDPGIRLTGGVTVDSREQERFADRVLRNGVEDERWLREGMSTLMDGELLPGWYDDWVVSERERLNQLRVHALERSAQALMRCGRLDAAVQAALEAVRCEPLRETANATLISVYLAEGNVWDAVRQYDSFKTRLRRELGVEPSVLLDQLLLRNSVSSSAQPGS